MPPTRNLPSAAAAVLLLLREQKKPQAPGGRWGPCGHQALRLGRVWVTEMVRSRLVLEAFESGAERLC